MKRYCLTLKLKNDPKLIAEYIEYHREVWRRSRKVFEMPESSTCRYLSWTACYS